MTGIAANKEKTSPGEQVGAEGMTQVERIELFDVPIACATLSDAVDIVEEAIAMGQRLDIGVVNAAKVVNMQSDTHLRESVLGSDIIFADGMSLVWASRLLGKSLPERVAGIDLMYALLERGNETGLKVFCLGAEEWVSELVAQRIKVEYPGVRLVGRRNGYFTTEEAPEVVKQIRDSQADVLFVAMSSPYKENFMAQWSNEMNVSVTHGVGGSFDVFAGKVARAPRYWQQVGLEWLYRLLQEPRRLWRRYLHTNWTFLQMLVRSVFSPDR